MARQAERLGIQPSDLIGFYIVRKARENKSYDPEVSDKEVEKRERIRFGKMSVAAQCKELGIQPSELIGYYIVRKARESGHYAPELSDEEVEKLERSHSHDGVLLALEHFFEGQDLTAVELKRLEGREKQIKGAEASGAAKLLETGILLAELLQNHGGITQNVLGYMYIRNDDHKKHQGELSWKENPAADVKYKLLYTYFEGRDALRRACNDKIKSTAKTLKKIETKRREEEEMIAIRLRNQASAFKPPRSSPQM